MTAPRTDFVQIPRPAVQDLTEVHGSAFELLWRLVIEADRRTGFVRGSERDLAKTFCIERRRFHRAAQELEGIHIRTTKAKNQHDENAGVLVLDYRSLAMRRSKSAGTETSPADGSAGTGAGTTAGTETGPARASDLQEQSYPQGDNKQYSVHSVRSARSFALSLTANGAKGAPSRVEKEGPWATSDEEIEYKRSLARRFKTEEQEPQRGAEADA